MKEVIVKYILGDFKSKEHGLTFRRFLVENEEDLQKLLDNYVIGTLQVDGIRNYIAKGEQVIVNEKGGYCNAKGTWEILKRL